MLDFTNAYDAGTFKLGQKLYHVADKKHIFHVKLKCDCCDSTGVVTIKGQKYKCPVCRGSIRSVMVMEKVVVGITYTVKGIYSYTNKKGTTEIYDVYGDGVNHIVKNKESCDFYTSREEAQKVCDEYNSSNGVYDLIEQYAALDVNS